MKNEMFDLDLKVSVETTRSRVQMNGLQISILPNQCPQPTLVSEYPKCSVKPPCPIRP